MKLYKILSVLVVVTILCIAIGIALASPGITYAQDGDYGSCKLKNGQPCNTKIDVAIAAGVIGGLFLLLFLVASMADRA